MQTETPETEERPLKSGLAFIVDAQLAVEKLRVATQVRQSHLKRRDRQDENTDRVLAKLVEVEELIDGIVASDITAHPAYPWFSRVKGIGRENIGKVVGLIDITRAPMISSLWKFAGFHVVDGHSPRREKGQKLEYNSQLRTMCWRLALSLIKANGKYADFYRQQKQALVERYTQQGMKIIPTLELPTDAKGRRYEPEGVIAVGHVANQAQRKMVKLFLSHLWLVWRQAEGLPIRAPYVQEYRGHTSIISPEEMLDKPAKVRKVRQRRVVAEAPQPVATA